MITDPRVDAYLAASAEFARPVLEHLRRTVHCACAELEETIKWGMPFFAYRGKPIASMAAFKAHCAFGFWHAQAVADAGKDDQAMGQFGHITRLADLPPKRELAAMVRKAVALVEPGVKPRAPKTGAPKPPPQVLADLAAGFKRAPAAQQGFASLAPSRQREYVEWLEEAKRPETRAKRLAQALEWLAEGKPRHWKYESC